MEHPGQLLCVAFLMFVIDGTCSGMTDSVDADALSAEEVHALNRFVRDTVSCSGIPGLAVTLVRGDEAVFSRGYGHAEIEAGKQATEHSKFCIGSLTKAFTSAVLADILSKNQSVTWDTKVKDILGDRFHLSDQLRTDHVTLRDLLAHKVGTPSYFHALLVGFPENMSRSDLVGKLQFMPATDELRTKFHYSNYMYMLAGHIAEVLTGESWEALVDERLLRRLNMLDTGFVDRAGSLEEIVTPYVLRNGKHVPVDKILLLSVAPSGPAGSVYSTASDMARWMLFHLRQGRNAHGASLVHSAWLEETYHSQMTHPFEEKDLNRPIFPISDVTLSYNMGWMTSEYRGYRKLWHSGGIVTFTSQLWLFPGMRSGVFVASNGPLTTRGSAALKTIAAFASDLLLREKPWLNVSTACSFPAPWEPAPEVPEAVTLPPYAWNITRPRSHYTGKYGNRGFGRIVVEPEGDKLMLRYGRFGKMAIHPVNDEEFRGVYVDKLWFITNSDGNVKRIPITFVLQGGQVTGLYMPVDFESAKTLFLKGADFNHTQSATSLENTSLVCASGDLAVVPYSALSVFLCSLICILNLHRHIH